MSEPPSTIEINGHRYDALTGQLINGNNTAIRAVKTASYKTLDGVVRGSQAVLRKNRPSAPRNRKPASSVHQPPQRSRTLMRKTVVKPAPKAPDNNTHAIKARAAQVSPAKLFRASQTPKSSKVDRFGHVAAPRTEVSKRPGAVKPTQLVPGPTVGAMGATAALARPLPAVNNLSHQQLERLLDHALARADAHKKMLEGKYGKRSPWQRIKYAPRWLSVGLTALILLAASGIVALKEVPQVSMKVAATRAHINATVPAYTPSGFSFTGPINYHDGAVTIKYATAGNSLYTLTQKASNWDSQSMAANVVPKNAQVQTSQVRGTTVYIYGADNDAAWVNNGILYKLKDSAGLNSEQILKIADSL